MLPAYNEVGNLGGVVEAALAVLPTVASHFEVLVVDDASRDGTAEVLLALEATHGGVVRALRHGENRGYGAALRTGFSAARYAHVFYTDSDGQFDLRELPAFLSGIPLERGDTAIIGYRAERRDPAHRKLNAFAWGSLMRLLFGVTARDIDCAFKLVPTWALAAAGLEAGGAFVSTELLAKLSRLGVTLHERAVTHHSRRLGVQTGAAPRVVLRAFQELFALSLRTWQFGSRARPALPARTALGGLS